MITKISDTEFRRKILDALGMEQRARNFPKALETIRRMAGTLKALEQAEKLLQQRKLLSVLKGRKKQLEDKITAAMTYAMHRQWEEEDNEKLRAVQHKWMMQRAREKIFKDQMGGV